MYFIVICPTWHPFQCPNGDCIPIKYLCDGSPDCSDEYDENKSMCTAGMLYRLKMFLLRKLYKL